MVRLRLCTAAALALLMVLAPSALAQSSSANWAGYAVHRSGQSFRQVVGVWREPLARCRPGERTSSSYWVGLGGYRTSSRALEQTGTEVDCTARGQMRAFAWFEVVPHPSVPVRLKVLPGDLIQGMVSVAGHRVRLSLWDLTRHTHFSKVLEPRLLDTSSAEWIVEAPSECAEHGRCQTLPLANFGSTRFGGAVVQPVIGEEGTIADARWQASRIRLIPQARVAARPGPHPAGEATPSALRGGGSAFTVSYSAPARRAPRLGKTRRVAKGELVHRALVLTQSSRAA